MLHAALLLRMAWQASCLRTRTQPGPNIILRPKATRLPDIKCQVTHVIARGLLQALFADASVGKLLPAFTARTAHLKAAGSEPAHQMAHLVALEHLTGVTLPDQVNEVRGRSVLRGAAAAACVDGWAVGCWSWQLAWGVQRSDWMCLLCTGRGVCDASVAVEKRPAPVRHVLQGMCPLVQV